MMRSAGAIGALSVALAMASTGVANATERGRGLPFRGADSHCVVVGPGTSTGTNPGTDLRARATRGDYRWFVTSLARFDRREDGCRVDHLTRYGQAHAWRARLACPGGTTHEDWTLNYDGSITAVRDGSKTTFRPCERGH